MDLKTEFAKAIRNSLTDLDETYLNRERNDGKYFINDYSKPIEDYFRDHNIVSLETKYSRRWKCTPICALASSARLCFLKFGNNDRASFEKNLKNDLNPPATTKMDAVIEETNYECKCQEILSKSHTPLNIRYLESEMFQEFGITQWQTCTVTSTDKATGKTRTWEALKFNVTELGIRLNKSVDYTNLRLDLKQMICHLIAIAKTCEGKPSSLQYVFFTPNKEQIDYFSKVSKLYEDLKAEWAAATKPDTAIRKFADAHKITIAEPQYVSIGDLPDFLVKKMKSLQKMALLL